MLTAHVELPGVSSSVPTARHFVESILTSWGDAETAWTGALLVTELATNCALHARTDFSVRVIQAADGHVRLEVTDASLRVLQQRSYGLDATTGRGLRLVDELGTGWGVTAREGGKTVWVDLPFDGMSGAHSNERDEAGLDPEALLAAFGDDDLAGPVVLRRGGRRAA